MVFYLQQIPYIRNMTNLGEIQDRVQQQNLKVTKSNVLINSVQNLSLTEHRLVRSSIAKINSLDDEMPKSTTISASEYKEVFGCENPYDEMRKGVDSLFEREVTYFDPKTETLERIRWVQKARYSNGTGSVTLYWSDDIKPHLVNMSGNFTSYHLKNIAYFKSKYSIQFYELLKQYRAIGERTMSVIQLKRLLAVEDKYPMFADFRKFVIEKSVGEINKHSDLNVEFEFLKQGRTISRIKFNINIKPQIEFDV